MKKLIIILIIIFVIFPLIACCACPIGCECVYYEDYIEVNCINGYSYNITEDCEKVRLLDE